MKQSDFTTYPYSYYPKTMIALCAAAYAKTFHDIDEAAKRLGLKVVWGPGEMKNWTGVSYSLMYVTHNPLTDEYTIVIRGTDPLSILSWLSEDFKIKITKPFSDFVPNAPAAAALSEGSYNGLNDLLSITDPKKGTQLVDFLKSVNPKILYVTGHSLGGTLVPPLFAYLNFILYGGGYVTNMACWSFAGLTSGNAAFAAYWNGLSNQDFAWRIHNLLDIAPYLFYSFSNIQEIYQTQKLSPTGLTLDILNRLFSDASGKNYTQPIGDQPLTGIFDANYTKWDDQAFYQHHATTYVALVNQFYGS